MKKIVVLLSFLSVGFINAQAFKGKGDIKGQVGANFQSGGTGITVSSDFGIGANMSFGFTATYLLNVPNIVQRLDETEFLQNNPNFDPIISGTVPQTTIEPSFGDRFDLKARFNANIGDVFKLDSKMDVYPGLDLGLRNFGAHLGVRYFFTDGFGVYAEGGTPLARYKTNLSDFDYMNNQFVFVLGASFNL